jgi:hypothetical protein
MELAPPLWHLLSPLPTTAAITTAAAAAAAKSNLDGSLAVAWPTTSATLVAR